MYKFLIVMLYLFMAIDIAITLMLVGNKLGDQLTIHDCNAKGTAKMLGGGVITCKVMP
jgi:hypothetical protein